MVNKMLIYFDDTDAHLLLQVFSDQNFVNKIDRMLQNRVKRIKKSLIIGLENY